MFLLPSERQGTTFIFAISIVTIGTIRVINRPNYMFMIRIQQFANCALLSLGIKGMGCTRNYGDSVGTGRVRNVNIVDVTTIVLADLPVVSVAMAIDDRFEAMGMRVNHRVQDFTASFTSKSTFVGTKVENCLLFVGESRCCESR